MPSSVGVLWGLDPPQEVLVRPPETHMRIADFLALLTAETPESFYVRSGSDPLMNRLIGADWGWDCGRALRPERLKSKLG